MVILSFTNASFHARSDNIQAVLPESLLNACEDGTAISVKDDPTLVQDMGRNHGIVDNT